MAAVFALGWAAADVTRSRWVRRRPCAFLRHVTSRVEANGDFAILNNRDGWEGSER
jgi:hypothetical protein